MRSFVDQLQALEQEEGILSISFVHGFPWGDMPDTGAKVLVYTDQDPDLAATVARNLNTAIWAIKDQTMPHLIPLEEAVARARLPRQRPLILADIADNPGGGAPSDSNFILGALLDGGIENAAVGLVFDPQAVILCHQVGPGGRLLLRVGGKLGPASGRPLDLDAMVVDIRSGAQMVIDDKWRFDMGNTAWIHAKGIDIVLCSVRVQLYHPSGFTHIGLDPAERRVLVIKSSNHFQAFFHAIADEIAWVDTPGALDFDFARLPYRRLTRPVHPRVADPFAEPGA
jgi:microcystin degradation protein MlrC